MDNFTKLLNEYRIYLNKYKRRQQERKLEIMNFRVNFFEKYGRIPFNDEISEYVRSRDAPFGFV
jgi:hypothetical protein